MTTATSNTACVSHWLTIAKFAAILLCCCAPMQAQEVASFQAGVAKVNITPPQPMWMAGYASRTKTAEGKSTELWAKALVLQDANKNRACLITLDLIGLDRTLMLSICQRLEKTFGLRREQIALNCSHTHSGPVVAGNLKPIHYLKLDEAQQKLVNEYAQLLEEKIETVVGEAIGKLAPAQLSWSQGLATFATNRRNNPEAEVPALREAGKLKGPVDHAVPVLAVRSPEGKLLAVTFGYACHSTTVSRQEWSGDYPGFAQIEIEAAHPEAIALFWAGCGGDQNPLPRKTIELAQEYGKKLASAVELVLAAPMQPLSGSLQTTYAEIPLPLDTLPTREKLLAEAAGTDGYVATRAKMLLDELAAGRELPATYPYPVSVWKLGILPVDGKPQPSLQWIFLGGEVVVDYAVRIKRELRGPQTWVAGYSHDVMAYIPSRRVLAEGGYEGASAMIYYGLPTTWAPAVEEDILTEVQRQVR